MPVCTCRYLFVHRGAWLNLICCSWEWRSIRSSALSWVHYVRINTFHRSAGNKTSVGLWNTEIKSKWKSRKKKFLSSCFNSWVSFVQKCNLKKRSEWKLWKKIVQSKGPNENDDQKNCPVKGAEWKWWSNRRSVHLLRSFAISSAKCGWWGEDSIYLLNSTTRGGGMMRRIRRMIIVWEVEDKILISEGKAADLAEE